MAAPAVPLYSHPLEDVLPHSARLCKFLSWFRRGESVIGEISNFWGPKSQNLRISNVSETRPSTVNTYRPGSSFQRNESLQCSPSREWSTRIASPTERTTFSLTAVGLVEFPHFHRHRGRFQDHATKTFLSPGFIQNQRVLRAFEICHISPLCCVILCPQDLVQTYCVLRAFSVGSV